MDNKETTIDSTYVYKGNVIDVKRDNIITSNGEKSIREVIEHPGGVVIVALHNNNIATVEQYRYAIKSLSTELPAGRLEPNEDILSAAKRELREETGFIAKQWIDLGYIYTTPGICDEKLYLFLAKDLTFTSTDYDRDEVIKIKEYPVQQFFDMIDEGVISDSKTICALFRARKYLK